MIDRIRRFMERLDKDQDFGTEIRKIDEDLEQLLPMPAADQSHIYLTDSVYDQVEALFRRRSELQLQRYGYSGYCTPDGKPPLWRYAYYSRPILRESERKGETS